MGRVERKIMGAPDHPDDHRLFSFLKAKGRTLGVCIPGRACHTDLTFSGGVNAMLIEPWAIEMMINKRFSQVRYELMCEENHKELNPLLFKADNKKGWEKLVALDVLYQAYK